MEQIGRIFPDGDKLRSFIHLVILLNLRAKLIRTKLAADSLFPRF